MTSNSPPSTPSRREKGLVVAIDGPSGAGKSTVGRALAKALSYTYLDTGAMYRALAVRALARNIPLDDEGALARAASNAVIDFDENGRRVLLDGRDVTEEIRTREVTKAASAIARMAAVRRELVHRQQELGRAGAVVLDGRDIGSVVFKDAELKFYLDAAPEKRARRRFNEQQAKDRADSFEAILEDIRARDYQDMTRQDSPLVRCADAHYIDTSDLSQDQVIARLQAIARARIDSK